MSARSFAGKQGAILPGCGLVITRCLWPTMRHLRNRWSDVQNELLPPFMVWLVATLLTSPLISDAHAEPTTPIEGVYARGHPNPSEIRIVARPGGRFRVEIHGGGDERMGAGVGADCYAVAEGDLTGNRLSAAFVPFVSPNDEFTAQDLASRPRQLDVWFDGQAIEVTGHFDYCALNTSLAGRYRRTERSRSFVNCPSTDRPCWAIE